MITILEGNDLYIHTIRSEKIGYRLYEDGLLSDSDQSLVTHYAADANTYPHVTGAR